MADAAAGPSSVQQQGNGANTGCKRSRPDDGQHSMGPSSSPGVKKAKIDALWQQLQSKAGAKQAPKAAAGHKALSLQAQLESDPRASSLGGLSAIIAGLQSKKGAQQNAAVSKPVSSGMKAVLAGLPSSKQVSRTDADLANAVRAASQLVKPHRAQSEEPAKQAPSAPVEPPPSKPALTGLDAALAGLQQKKTTVLGNTKQDWKQFKAADADVNEELESYKKSNNKYLDKVNFLKRAELMEYERERDERTARRPIRSDTPSGP